jgi:hypothetical protein
MKYRLLYLLTGILILVSFVQCKNSVTKGSDGEIELDLEKFSLIAPAINSEQPTSLTFEWNDVEMADSFHIKVAIDKEFTNILADSTVDSTQFSIQGLPYKTKIYWQVRPVVKGHNTTWSDTWEVNTVAKPDQPDSITTRLQAPEDRRKALPANVEFEWQAVAGASAYNLELTRNQNFDNNLVEKEIEGTSFQYSDLESDQDYYWRVEPVINGRQTKWSEVQTFTTKVSDSSIGSDSLSAPVQVSPNDGTSDVSLKPTFKWQAVEGTDTYILHASYENKMAIEKKVKDTTYTPTNDLTAQSTHYWRVRAVKDGNKGKWSNVMDFKTISEGITVPAVALISPSQEATNQSTSLTLEWEELSGIDSYHLQLATSSSFSSPVIDKTIKVVNYDAKDLENSQQYYWRVQATGDSNNSNWSSTRSFTTEAQNNNGPTGSVSADRAALMALYEATGGDGWKNNSGWGSGDPSDAWHGIETDANGRVVRVDLFKNNLKGHLPASIGHLDKVTYLNVKNNYLTGEIPPDIGEMASLEWLILAGRTYEIGGTLKEPPQNLYYAYHQGKRYSNTNNFDGVIPSTVGKLSELLFLEIANQPNIVGPIPSEIGNLTQLKGLYLSFNDFSGTTLPSSMGELTNLKHLYIASAQLEGEIPASWRNLTKLIYLNMGESSNSTPENHLTGTIPDFSQFTNLRSIVLTSNDLTGEYPHFWNNGNFTKLNTLRLSWNNLTGNLHGFNNLPYLKSFGIEGNNMSGSIDKITEMPFNIKIIGLGWNNFSGDFPEAGWPDFSQIKTAYFNDNNLTGRIPCSFWEKLDNPELNIAWFGSNDLTDTCESGFNKMKGDESINS